MIKLKRANILKKKSSCSILVKKIVKIVKIALINTLFMMQTCLISKVTFMWIKKLSTLNQILS